MPEQHGSMAWKTMRSTTIHGIMLCTLEAVGSHDVFAEFLSLFGIVGVVAGWGLGIILEIPEAWFSPHWVISDLGKHQQIVFVFYSVNCTLHSHWGKASEPARTTSGLVSFSSAACCRPHWSEYIRSWPLHLLLHQNSSIQWRCHAVQVWPAETE